MKKVSLEERKRLAETSGDDLMHDLVDDLKGFSKVIQALSKEQKPLVGHNCLGDIIRMYQQFVDDLPDKYSEFKRVFHLKFPTVIDTKQVSFVLRRQLEREEHKAAGMY